MSGASTTPSGGTIALTTYNPNWTLTGATGTTASSSTVNLPFLSQTGTYSVLLEPPNANTGSVQVTLLSPNSLTVNGSSFSVPTTGAGQNTYFTFSGTAGQNATFAMSSVVITPAGGLSSVNAYQPNGSRIAFTTCSTSTCSLALTNLPVTGTYEVVTFAPGSASTMSYSATVTSP